MTSNSLSSFVNGLIAGAGAVLAIMSVAFLRILDPSEGTMGFTTTEIRVGILLGGIVCAAAISYEFYSKKKTKENQLLAKRTEEYGIEKEKTQEREDKGVNVNE